MVRQAVRESQHAKVILSSFGFRGDAMRERFKRVIDPCTVADSRCLLVPFAGINAAATAAREREGLIAFGFSKDNVITAGTDALLPQVDYVYVCGGDPFLLANELQRRQLVEPLRRLVAAGATYIGVSAGAYLASPSLAYVRQIEASPVHGTEETLALLTDSVLCHAEHYASVDCQACEAVCGGKPLPAPTSTLIHVSVTSGLPLYCGP